MNRDEFGKMLEANNIAFIGEAAWRVAQLVAAAERERCAKVCDQLQGWPEGATPYDCAAAIRSAE